MSRWLRKWLQHPLTRDLRLDDPATTALRREIVRGKPSLRGIYVEWYKLLQDSLPDGPGAVLELGSGAGFFREIVPQAITSEVFPCPDVQLVLDGHCLPFATGSLRAVTMVDVLHHLSDCRRFFTSAARCVRSGGVIAAVEPWVSSWSRLVYGRLHHEPFRPDAATWEFPPVGPLSGANQALPWIVFQRDRSTFEREFPQWRVTRVRPFMPFRYLATGGVGLRTLAPGWAFQLCKAIEYLLTPATAHLAMFAELLLERTSTP